MKWIIDLPDGRTPKMCTPESGNSCEDCGMVCALDNAKKAEEVDCHNLGQSGDMIVMGKNGLSKIVKLYAVEES